MTPQPTQPKESMSKKYIYKHQDVKAHYAQELIDYLNEQGKNGWQLVSHKKSSKLGYASIILMKEQHE